MQFNLEISFRGDRADDHRLPAYSATESLDGIARATLIMTNYLVERRVRRKEFKYQGYDVDLVALTPGSFNALFDIHIADEYLHYLLEVGVGVTAGGIVELFKGLFRRSIGRDAPTLDQLEAQDALPAGDLGAVLDAAEPALRRAHTVVNHGANRIVLISGDNNIVTFNDQSKQYVYENVFDNEPRSKLFSIGSYNVNSRYGRAFDYDLGKTIPFEVAQGADAATISAILGSIRDYGMSKEGQELNSAIALLYTRVLAVDGRVKKLKVSRARQQIADL